MKIAVIGGCHAPGIALALSRLAPDAEVVGWHVGAPRLAEDIAADLPGQDVIVSQVADLSGECLGISRLRETFGARKAVVFLPTIIFMGLQPDATYLSCGGAPIPSCTGAMHSVIVAAAYEAGIRGTSNVAALFATDIYQRLGYTEEFERSKGRLIEQYAYQGFDLAPYVARWTGAFMHVPNHPRIDVLAATATLAARQAGIVSKDTRPPEGLRDYLATHEQWPVYPFTGAPMIWRRSTHGPVPAAGREMSLADFIEAEYDIFRANPGLRLSTPRMRAARAAIEAI